MKELFTALAPLLGNDIVILSAVALLTAVTLLAAWNLGRATGKVVRALSQARSALTTTTKESFAVRLGKVNQTLLSISLIAAGWRPFHQSFIVPATESEPVIATAEVRSAFDGAGLLRRAGINPRLHAALPGLLVGAGLFATFLGLAVALSAAGSVVAEGVPQADRTRALRNLLDAASVKFLTSLAGLGLSMAYTAYHKRCLRRVDESVSSFAEALESQVVFKTSAVLLAEGNALLAKQYAEVQRVGTDFFINLGSTLEREFGEGLAQHIGPLAAAIETLSSGLSNQNEDALRSMLEAFSEKLEGATGESMRGTAGTLEKLGERLDGLQSGMDAAAERMGRAAEEMATRLGRGTEAALGGITEQMGGLVRALREAAEEAGRGNRVAGDDMARRMENTASALTAAVAIFQERMEQGAAEGVGRLTAPIEAMLVQLRDLADGQRRAGAESNDALAATIARAAGALETTADRVAQAMGGGAADASARLVAATEAMRDELRGVLARFGDTLDQTGAALTRSAAAGGDALRGAAAALGVDMGASALQLREAAEAAGVALREGGRSAGSELAEASRVITSGTEGLRERLSALGDASARLAEGGSALDRALRASVPPLATGAADMRAAAEAARSALQPWQDTARELRGAVDGLVGAAAAIQGAQERSKDLSCALADAASRFSGLDQNLARTLSALGGGLAEYHRDMSRFLEGLDLGMAKSISGLQSVASSLEDAIEELANARPAARLGAGSGR